MLLVDLVALGVRRVLVVGVRDKVFDACIVAAVAEVVVVGVVRGRAGTPGSARGFATNLVTYPLLPWVLTAKLQAVVSMQLHKHSVWLNARARSLTEQIPAVETFTHAHALAHASTSVGKSSGQIWASLAEEEEQQ